MAENNSQPKDIELLKPWLGLVRRLRSKAKKAGASIITIKAIIDENGEPVRYTTPKVEKIEGNRSKPVSEKELDALAKSD